MCSDGLGGPSHVQHFVTTFAGWSESRSALRDHLWEALFVTTFMKWWQEVRLEPPSHTRRGQNDGSLRQTPSNEITYSHARFILFHFLYY